MADRRRPKEPFVPEPPLWEQIKELADTEGERLQKVMAARGYGSRRACELLIDAGRVLVNGEPAVLGRRVRPDLDDIIVEGVTLVDEPNLVYFLLNKPVGVLSTAKDTHGRPIVVGLVPADMRVYPVGRLDAETEGLLLLTNDGQMTHRLTHPSYGIEKEYLVTVEGKPSMTTVRHLADGVELDDGVTAPATVSIERPGVLRVVIHEGRNRQVRRMCEAVGHPVVALTRVRFGPIRDEALRPGQWRPLTSGEVTKLRRAARLAG